jgi:hypothetical protein
MMLLTSSVCVQPDCRSEETTAWAQAISPLLEAGNIYLPHGANPEWRNCVDTFARKSFRLDHVFHGCRELCGMGARPRSP